MSTIVLNDEAAEELKKCTTSAILRDSAGNVVGYFERRLYDPSLIPEFDEAELKRRETNWQGIPSAEVRRRLLEELR
jgi:hypothetical protein